MNLSAADKASDGDRRFFERNPRRRYRIRPAHDGELPGAQAFPDLWACVCVVNMQPGARMRLLFWAPQLPPDLDHVGDRLRQLFLSDRTGAG